jgi:hypothetical protein
METELLSSFSIITQKPRLVDSTDTKLYGSFSIMTQEPRLVDSTDTKLLHNISAIDAFAEGKNVDMFTTIICDS